VVETAMPVDREARAVLGAAAVLVLYLSSPVENCARPPPNDQSASEFSTRETIRSSGDRPQWICSFSASRRLDDPQELIAVPGLAEEWKRRLGERVKWLRKSIAPAV
jgi:hypothetical protein